MGLASINPATGKAIQTFDEHSERSVEEKLERARTVFATHRHQSYAQKARALAGVAGMLESEKESFGKLMVEEMGKTYRAALAELEKCARACRHYAEHAPRYLADEPVESDTGHSYLRFLPLGPILGIMPWNFPFWQVIRFAAPTVMAGNVAVLKHASNVPRCALALESVFERAGFAPGVFQTLLVGSKRMDAIVADPRIQAISLTGSDKAGAHVASVAGTRLKKCVLELGGSDPFIVMPSADFEAAVKTAVMARIINNGQSCIAAKRFIVHRDIYARFEKRFVELMAALKVGDPMLDTTDLGPLATKDVLQGVDAQVRQSVQAGARLLTGGQPLPGPGFFYAPTVLAEIPKSAPARHEEIFGPVASLFQVRDVDEAIAVANETPFGLGSSVWTQEEAEQRRFVDEVEAGQTFINAMVASDPRLPFGGVKHSGYGRELGGLGIREFVNIKTISIAGAKRHPASATE